MSEDVCLTLVREHAKSILKLLDAKTTEADNTVGNILNLVEYTNKPTFMCLFNHLSDKYGTGRIEQIMKKAKQEG